LTRSSDNGPHKEAGADPDFFNSNGELNGYKRDFTEGGIRVLFMVRWPGKVKAASTSFHDSAFWDEMPTLAQIAQTDSPKNLDGLSFLPTLLGKKKPSTSIFIGSFMSVVILSRPFEWVSGKLFVMVLIAR
jgi:arylsulfatase A-like enzyme